MENTNIILKVSSKEKPLAEHENFRFIALINLLFSSINFIVPLSGFSNPKKVD